MALIFDRAAIRLGDFALSADWQVTAGERVALIGPSGAGKSTLLMALAGFVPLASGRISWEGRDLGPLPPAQRPVATLFQDQNLFPHLTVAQNVGLGLSPRLRLDAEQTARVAEVLDRVGLRGLEGRRASQLSGGQQGRAALARALLQARPVLMLDEPFAALGPRLKADMLDLVAELAHGVTLLMVTHDPRDAGRIAERTVLVADGVAHPPEPTGPLLDAPPPALRDYLG
ncbi:ATP-binding cassette domain-containing protein [Falsirhodobacter algicola]|uniref:ATP-binding cassette domain-containing protein n=1 Tax=Falsirhodobacter algicola TaxID=2692330 RepID=A0A8J8SLE1_9RHOB|nr:ATP-binding cassette domain-containing protein [Falsirhodobacter algicola]QUS36387.1 ATP-binding cassette domain-containing protein [Falsirhodobacter algicola]